MVRYSCAQRVRDMVTTDIDCPSGVHSLAETDPLQVYALRWLLEKPGLDCTVVEMEKAQHVADAMLSLRRE